jgi:hypothetical protein
VFPLSLPFKPLYGLDKPFFKLNLRTVTESLTGSGDISKRIPDISGTLCFVRRFDIHL